MAKPFILSSQRRRTFNDRPGIVPSVWGQDRLVAVSQGKDRRDNGSGLFFDRLSLLVDRIPPVTGSGLRSSMSW